MQKMKNRILRRLITMTLAIALILSVIPADSVFAFESITLKTVDFGGVTYDVVKDEDMAWEVLDIVNQERKLAGLSELTMDQKLMDVAMGRAAEITRNFSHLRPNGTQCFTAYPMASEANGYRGLIACAENIAAGQLTAAAVMKAWMNSTGHKSNILSPKYKSIGIGCVKTGHGYNYYWIQSFGDKVLEEAVRPRKGNIDKYVYDGLDYSYVFDADYYLDRYSDLRQAFGTNGTKAFAHFLKYGMNEGRKASDNFDVHYYKNNYADLRAAFGNDLKSYYVHYLKHGRRERRVASNTIVDGNSYGGIDYSPVFDATYYANKYSDLKNTFGTNREKLLLHFINYGMREGRQAKATFDVRSYKNRYQDLRIAFGSDLKQYYLHYINFGQREKRNPLNCPEVQNPVVRMSGINYSPVYDYYEYQMKNPDVMRAFGNDDIATLRHFIKNGMREMRRAKSSFNVFQYVVNYQDLRKAFGDDFSAYYMHYIRNGVRERRSANGNATYSQAINAIAKDN